MKANLDQGQVHGTYDFTNNDAINDIIDSVDFGISIIDNKIESSMVSAKMILGVVFWEHSS